MISVEKLDAILDDAAAVSDYLLLNSNTDQFGLYWKNLVFVEETNTEYKVSETIYGGNAGILLFYLELYKQCGDAKYLSIIEQSTNWLIKYCNSNFSSNPSFFTGRLGVAYVLLQVYELTRDREVYKAAETIARRSFEKEAVVCGDLLHGYAGVLIGLMHLYRYFPEDWVLQKLDKYAELIIKSAHISFSDGVSWGRNNMAMKNLCGFSHGVSGIAFSLIALGKFCNNDAFYWLARQAIRYENAQFDPEIGEWPDYRKDGRLSKVQEHVTALSEGNLESFFTPGRYNFWCHGATGIALTRLQLYSLWQNETDLSDFRKAIEIIDRRYSPGVSKASFTLCHGCGADALLFLEAFRYFGNVKYLKKAQEIFEASRNSYATTHFYKGGHPSGKPEFNLFMGAAGIGYFYLKMKDFNKSLNILMPEPTNDLRSSNLSSFKFLSIDTDRLTLEILNRNFPKTLQTVKKKGFKIDTCHMRVDSIDPLSGIEHAIKTTVGDIEQEMIILTLETEENKLKNGNYHFHHIRKILLSGNLHQFYDNKGDPFGARLILDPYIQLFSYENAIGSSFENSTYVLLHAGNCQAPRLEISQMAFNVLNLCKLETCYKEILERLLEIYDVEEKVAELEKFLKVQIVEWLNVKILLLAQVNNS